MPKKMNLLLVVLIAAAVMQCSNNPTATDRVVSRELTASEKLLVESDNKFGLKLFKEIVNEEKDKNVFISPLSVSMALGMTYNGAAGTTQEAMQKIRGPFALLDLLADFGLIAGLEDLVHVSQHGPQRQSHDGTDRVQKNA